MIGALTVRELFDDVSPDLLDELDIKAEKNEYWQASQKFISENVDKRFELLSFKQRQWVEKIISGLQDDF